MQRHLYPADWKERVQQADQRAGGRCERCGAVLGTMRLSRKHKLYLMPLHTSHVNHDPENPQAQVEKLCPSCHGKSHPWLPGTPTKERPYGYQTVTLARVLQAARVGGLEITPHESGTCMCWRIASLSGTAPDVLDAVSQALHCLRMERLEPSMDEQQWACYLCLLACHETTLPSACVGCWYEQHPVGEAFPGDQVSSTLCCTHRMALPVEVKQPDTLGQRRYA